MLSFCMQHGDGNADVCLLGTEFHVSAAKLHKLFERVHEKCCCCLVVVVVVFMKNPDSSEERCTTSSRVSP